MTKKVEICEKLVPDTSVIIEGIVSRNIKKGLLKADTIIIHEAVLAELEHQANQNMAKGNLGLEETQNIKELSDELGFKIEFHGKRPSITEIKYAKLGEIDSLIRDLAYDLDATLFTADKIQAKVAKSKGMKVILVEVERLFKKLALEKFFDEQTMSVHLRENVPPYAKRGIPGNWQFLKIREKQLTREEIENISRELIEEAGIRKDGFIEIERPGSTIVQLGLFRIVITKPAFSDGWEITAVRPVKKLNISEYSMSEKLMQRISEQAEGILIAGSPGHGKSTFASALAEHYASKEKIVKTIEAPRDLILPDNITQYALSHGDAQEIHDILLLSRPDYTIFDEMRNTSDFKLFADLRLSGIGLAGVVHATNPIDAIQRFVGRIELGVIPHIIDTVIFIKNGKIAKVLGLEMVVKVPSGMTEADLARPIVVVTDFETGKLEFELYSYGEETVVIPVKAQGKKPASSALAEKSIEEAFRRITDRVKAELISENKCIVYVPSEYIARVIGKEGQNINEMERKLGLSIDVKELGIKKSTARGTSFKEHGESLNFEKQVSKKNVEIYLDHNYANRPVDIFVDGDYLLTAHVGKNGLIKIKKSNKIGKLILDAINSGSGLEIFPGKNN